MPAHLTLPASRNPGRPSCRAAASALGLVLALSPLVPAPAALAQEAGDGLGRDIFVGTVVASEITALSYETRGCIVAVSEPAKRTGTAEAGQVLVRLDRDLAELGLASARARVADLEAAVAERQLAVDAARADTERRAQEAAFVAKEFERNQTMFRRSLINETTMEAVERRMMDANFAVDRAREALESAASARARAEIALEIGRIELRTAEVDLAAHDLTAPFDGVLLGFEPNVGDCVQEGQLAAQIYDPSKKAVDIFVHIDQLVASEPTGVAIGRPVKVERVNGETCAGRFTWIGTEANLENQYVRTRIDVEESCAAALFLNEAVEVEPVPTQS